MSIKALANNLQSHGRGNDTMLIHMSPREVGGLQALAKAHGGSLTKNPSTGLPEAGFLEDILPSVIGGVVGFATGMPWLGAAVGGVGGLAANQGDIAKGLTSAVGAYGLGGLGSSVAGMGAGEAALAADTANFANLGSATPAVAGGGGAAAGANAASRFADLGAGWSKVMEAPGAFLQSNIANVGMAATPLLTADYEEPASPEDENYSIRDYDYSQTVNPAFGAPGEPYFIQTYTPQFADGGIAALQGPYTRAPRTVDPAVTAYNRELMNRAKAEYLQSPQLGAFQSAIPNQGAFNPQAAAALQQQQTQPAGQTEATQFGYKYDPATNQVIKTQPSQDQFAMLQQQIADLRNQQMQGPNYYGDFDGGFGTGANDMGAENASAADMGGEDVARGGLITRKMAMGGISQLNQNRYNLGGYSDGGRLLKGPGDGVSDSIPATIEGKQPARLADGEFVIPARIVSEIGNGSTDAGARKLYAMMNRVQKKRAKTTGKNRVAVNTRADKELPV